MNKVKEIVDINMPNFVVNSLFDFKPKLNEKTIPNIEKNIENNKISLNVPAITTMTNGLIIIEVIPKTIESNPYCFSFSSFNL
jgi:hypothetical protein